MKQLKYIIALLIILIFTGQAYSAQFIPKYFLQLRDVPNSFSGSGGFCTKVNVGATALEFVSCETGSHASFLTAEADPIVASQTVGFSIARGTTPKTLTVTGDATISGTPLYSVASDSDWTVHGSYPAACTNQFIRALGDTNTCASVGIADLASVDFGSWTCNGTTCTIDNSAVGIAQLASVDFGGFTCNGSTCTIDSDSSHSGFLTSSSITSSISDSDTTHCPDGNSVFRGRVATNCSTLHCDGTTDDASHINTCISTLSGTGGGVISFPHGKTCAITSPVLLKDNVHIDFNESVLKWTGEVGSGFIDISVVNGGTNYTLGDILYVVQGGNTTGTVAATAVSGGIVTQVSPEYGGAGTGYTVATPLSTTKKTCTNGACSGLTVNLSRIGSSMITGLTSGSPLINAGINNLFLDPADNNLTYLDLHTPVLSKFSDIYIISGQTNYCFLRVRADVALVNGIGGGVKNAAGNEFHNFGIQVRDYYSYVQNGVILGGAVDGNNGGVTNNIFTGKHFYYVTDVGIQFLSYSDTNLFPGYTGITLVGDDNTGTAIIFNNSSTPSIPVDAQGYYFANLNIGSWYQETGNIGKKGIVLNKTSTIKIDQLLLDTPWWQTGGANAANTIVDNYADDYEINKFEYGGGNSNTPIRISKGTGPTIELKGTGNGIKFSDGSILSSATNIGNVVGPSSATDNAIARFDSTTGKLIQNSAFATLSDTGILELSTVSTSPSINLRVNASASATYPSLNIYQYKNGYGGQPITSMLGARGVYGAATAIQSGDGMGMLSFYGYGSTGFQWAGGINAVADGTFTDVNQETHLEFSTGGIGSNGTPPIRMTINSLGNVGINTSGPDRKLDVLDASNPQMRLTQTDGSVYTDFQTDSSGYLKITPSGNRVGIGLAPLAQLHVSDGNALGNLWPTPSVPIIYTGQTAVGPEVYIASSANAGTRAIFVGTRSRNTLAAPTAVTDGDYLVSLLGKAYDGTNTRISSEIYAAIDGSVYAGAKLNAGGTGYTVNDVLTIAGGTSGTVTVAAVSGGVVTRISLTAGGTGYSTGTGVATSGGTGANCTVDIDNVVGGVITAATPSKVIISTTGANSTSRSAKVFIMGNGNVGIGTTLPGTNNKLEVKDGHIANTMTTAPALSDCGTGSTIAGTDHSGVIIIGSTITACTMTFNLSFNNDYVQTCFVAIKNAANTAYVSAISKSAVTFTFGSGTPTLFYRCDGS